MADDDDIEWIPLAPLSDEFLEWYEWITKELFRRFIEAGRLPVGSFSYGFRAESSIDER